jgi:hypothetical protein
MKNIINYNFKIDDKKNIHQTISMCDKSHKVKQIFVLTEKGREIVRLRLKPNYMKTTTHCRDGSKIEVILKTDPTSNKLTEIKYLKYKKPSGINGYEKCHIVKESNNGIVIYNFGIESKLKYIDINYYWHNKMLEAKTHFDDVIYLLKRQKQNLK